MTSYTTVISTNQHFVSTFSMQIFKFQRRSCKLPLPAQARKRAREQNYKSRFHQLQLKWRILRKRFRENQGENIGNMLNPLSPQKRVMLISIQDWRWFWSFIKHQWNDKMGVQQLLKLTVEPYQIPRIKPMLWLGIFFPIVHKRYHTKVTITVECLRRGGCRSALWRSTGLRFRPVPVPSLHKWPSWITVF